MSTEHRERTRSLYRSRKGRFLGVCRGVADYLDFPVFWIRLIVVGMMFFSGFWPVVAFYFVAALLMKPEPVMPVFDPDDAEFYSSLTSSRAMALERLRRTYEQMDRRLQRMEGMVTSREYDWERRLNSQP